MHPVAVTDARQAGCPVCGLTIGSQRTCPECGWELRTEPRPGPLSPRLRAEFDQQFRRACRAWDSGIAARVSAKPETYSPQIRYGPPDQEEWSRARRNAARLTKKAQDEESLRAMLIKTLCAIDYEDTFIVEIDPRGITVTRAHVDQLGFARLHREQKTRPWTSLLPVLAADARQRDFQLAGGLAGLDRALLWDRLEREVPRISGGQLVVVCKPAGWPVLERAGELACRERAQATLAQMSAAKSLAARGGLLSRLANETLLRGRAAVVAVADPATKEVRLETRPLFPPGGRLHAEAELSLCRAPGDQGRTALAVVVGEGAAAQAGRGAGRPPLSLWSLPPQPGRTYRVRAALDEQLQARFTEPAGVVPCPEPWPTVLGKIPRKLGVALGPVDLICALELSGRPPTVSRRQRLIRELLDLVRAEYPQEMLRVATLGYVEHFRGGEERRNVVRGSTAFASADQALEILADLRAEEISYPECAAPLEDALQRAVRLLSGRHAQDQAAARLLVVAGRLPHPASQPPGKTLLPCPAGLNWQALLGTLTGRLGASCVVVADAIRPGRAGRGAEWQQLGQAAPPRELPAARARQVGEDLQVLVRPDERVPVPLATRNEVPG
jgi:hypothetical protein